MKTKDELKKLAVDIVDGKVFTSNHLSENNAHMLGQIFLPISLGAFSKKSKEEINDIVLIYEYYTKAGPISINGLPSFFSFQYLTKDELKELNKYYKKYINLKKEFNDN